MNSDKTPSNIWSSTIQNKLMKASDDVKPYALWLLAISTLIVLTFQFISYPQYVLLPLSALGFTAIGVWCLVCGYLGLAQIFALSQYMLKAIEKLFRNPTSNEVTEH